MRKISLEQIQEDAKKVYDTSFEISLLQEGLEGLLTAIDRNSLEYQKGEIPRSIFESNETKLKRESARKIRRINWLVERELKLLEKIKKGIQSSTEEAKPKKAKGTRRKIKKRKG